MTNSYQLKMTLRGIKPAIWRRVVVPGNLDLARLHRVIQDAMGWDDAHLHSFTVRGIEFGVPDRDGWGGPEVEPEDQHMLESLVAVKDRFRYIYDFGDDWVHDIVVEKIAPGEPSAPRCVAGKGACPPEDCGGAPGYARLVAALADDNHEDHEELAGWAPVGWAPDRFDLELADRRVARHLPKPGRPRAASKKRPPRTWARG